MTRNIHDSFAKEWMKKLLEDFGSVEVEKEVAGEVHTIDVVFYPNPTATPLLYNMGLLGRMVTILHLAVLQINLEARQNRTNDVREVMMSLSPAYEQWKHDNLAQERQEGRQEERQEIAHRMLQAGASLEFVAIVTGYSTAEIQSLQAT